MTGQDGNSAMKAWVEAAVGEPGHRWIDGRALNETLQLRRENESLRRQIDDLRQEMHRPIPPLVSCDKVAGDVMELSAPGMRAHCEHERPGESRVQMRRTDTGESIADVTVHPINDEDLTTATLEIVRGLYFSWWRAEARDGRRWETT